MANARIGSTLPFKGTGANYVETIDTDGKQLGTADSGKTFFCVQNSTADVTCNLPAISAGIAGWNAKFILSTQSGNDFQIMPYGGVTAGGTSAIDDKFQVNRGAGPLIGSATVDVADLADTTGSALFDITVTGADLGDFALASCIVDIEGLLVTANIRAANTVEVSVHNESGGSVNVASTTWKAAVFSGNPVQQTQDSIKFTPYSPLLSIIDIYTDGTYWYAISTGGGAEGVVGVDS